MLLFFDFLLSFLAFITIWFGAGLVVEAIEDLSHKLNISSFATSFFVLGILTSLPEFSVGLNSILNGNPEIFVGNLIGASLVLFIFVIPVLAILGKGVTLNHQLNAKKIAISLFVVAIPSFLIVDEKVTSVEGLLLIILYFILFYLIEKKKGLFERIIDRIIDGKTHIATSIGKAIGGALIIFFSSSLIVDKTIVISQVFNISPYIISLLGLSIGTNLPELSLAVRSVSMGKKEVALGDYLGSASANTLLFGLLVILNKRAVIVTDNFLKTLIFMVTGLGLFFLFTRSKNDISQKEGVFLFLIYLIFIFFEVFS